MHSHGVWQPSFALYKLSKRRRRKTEKRAMEIIYPDLSYAKALELSAFLTLYDRKEAIAAKLFDEICANQFHSLHKLLASIYISLASHADYIGGSSPLRTSAWESSHGKLLCERTQNIYSSTV